MAVKEIRGEDDYSDSEEMNDSDDEADNKKQSKFVDSANLFGVKAHKSQKIADARETGKTIDSDKVLKAARKVIGGKDNSESDQSEDDAEFTAKEKKQKSN